MSLPPMSEEQFAIYDEIAKGNNVIVDACAGSGKSTTILNVAKKMPHKRILQITYNSMLRKEVQTKVEALQLNNITVHTFHSLCVAHYDPEAFTDLRMRQVLHADLPPRQMGRPFSLLVLDEAQDMTFLYFQFILKFLRDHPQGYGKEGRTKIQLMVLGDYRQGLYEFKGADIRFLTQAESIWKRIPYIRPASFVSKTLKTSYRITIPMAHFVNDVMLGETRLHAIKEGTTVCYIRSHQRSIESIVLSEIQRLIADEGAQPEDFFILGASLKATRSATSIRRIENVLVEQQIPCHVPIREESDAGLDERIIHGKVVFSTFHSVKGRQRPYTFVFGFDNNYFTTYNRNHSPNACPNTLYVATTRAMKRLYVLESNQRDIDQPLPFLRMNHSEIKKQPYVSFCGQPQNIVYRTAGTLAASKSITVKPSELLRFVRDSIIQELTPDIMALFEPIPFPDSSEIEMPVTYTTSQQKTEEVSDLNGVAIPSMYFDLYLHAAAANPPSIQHNTLYTAIMELYHRFRCRDYPYLRNILDTEVIPMTTCHSISDYLFLANVYTALKEQLYFKLHQLPRNEYTWLSDDVVQQCHHRMTTVLGEDTKDFQAESEIWLVDYPMKDEQEALNRALADVPELAATEFYFVARVDLQTDTTIWEWKCCKALSIDNFAQVLMYAWIWNVLEPESPKRFKLFNIKTGEYWQLKDDVESCAALKPMVVRLLQTKFCKNQELTDEEFLEMCDSSF